MKPKISVLVPIYNVEKYLQRCIDSIISQSFTDWEMILVDDGSPDGCGVICDFNHNANPDKIRVIHKPNGGLLSARQVGVREAKGEYLVFWDSDDTAPQDALQVLYDAITSNEGYDVVRATGKRVAIGGDESDLEPYPFKEGEIIGHEEYLRKQFTGQIPPYLWNAIYKASLFDDEVYNTSIKAGVSLGEDWVTNMILALKIERALVIDKVVYYYYYNPASIMGSSIFGNEYQDKVDAVLTKMGVLTHPAIKDLVERKAVGGIIRNCFIPELPFDLKRFKRVQNFVSNSENLEVLKQKIDKRFLKFITWLPLFYIYSRAYCLIFKWVKLKGKSRKIIK